MSKGKRRHCTVTLYIPDEKKAELIEEVCEALSVKLGKQYSRSRFFNELADRYLTEEGLMRDGRLLKKDKRPSRLKRVSLPIEAQQDGKKKKKAKSDSGGSSVRSGGARRRPGTRKV